MSFLLIGLLEWKVVTIDHLIFSSVLVWISTDHHFHIQPKQNQTKKMSQKIYLFNLSFIICVNLLFLKLCLAQSTDTNSSELMEIINDGERSIITLIADRLIDIFFRINWPALFAKLLKTLVAFMIDVFAGAFLGKSSLASPLTSF